MRDAILKDWSMATAASLALYVTGFALPVLTLPTTLIYPLPAVFLAFGRGFFCSLTSTLLASLLAGGALLGSYGITCFFMFGLPGVLIGYIADKCEKSGSLLVASASVGFACKLAGGLILYSFFGFNLLAPGAAELEGYLNYFGVPADPAVTRAIVDRAILLVPYNMIFFSTVESVVCLLLTSAIQKKRTGEAFFVLPPFSEWAFPKNILFTLVVGFICARMAKGREDLYLLRLMGANLSELSRTILAVQGLSCACFFMERFGVPKPFRIAVIISTPFISLLGSIWVTVGLTDIGFNVRDKIGRILR
ncbi:MAG: YybS family protein [Synergistaceae bacterium]|jgi:uncharacterized protein YybS (DUF2232 family)|nr:YybS family protein [Synergistaceae bacterium]